MGWVWKDEEYDDVIKSPSVRSMDIPKFNSSNEDRFSTRKIVKSQCRTEEVEPGRFIRKCEKIEQTLKECAGRPTEVVQSNKEYTEDDVTDEVMNGSFSSGSTEIAPFNFPGLRDDIDAIERNLFGDLARFLDAAAEEMKNGFFNAIGSQHDRESSSSSSIRRGIPIASQLQKEPNNSNSGDVDLAGLARDV